MTHPNAHGGYATQAKRRTEQYVACNTCGGRAHPRRSMEIEPVLGGWREVAEIVGGFIVFTTLFIGIPFLLFLAAAS